MTMKSRRVLLVALACALPVPSEFERSRPAKPSAAEVLGRWMTLYHQGKLDLSGQKAGRRGRGAGKRAKDFVSIVAGLVSPEHLPRMTYERELRLLCKATLEQQDSAAARALLAVAAVGLDQRPYPPESHPVTVRQIGERHLLKLELPQPLAHIVTAAQGKRASIAIRAAALRNLGARRDELYRPHLEAALQNKTKPVRLAAAAGLGRSNLKTAVPALADQLLRERCAAVQIQLLDALGTLAKNHGEQLDDRDLRRATTTALGLLTLHGWNVDLAALDFLSLVRSADTVPRLIEMLCFYARDRRTRHDATHSSTARHRAHELLRSLTGAAFAMNRTELWQQWWEQNQDSFVLAAPRPSAPAEGQAVGTTSSFFGIPVRGTRIVFIVDVSTSMEWDSGSGEAKIAVAKHHLETTVENLSHECQFGLVTFALRGTAWKKRLVPATKASKKSFCAYLDRLRCGPHTNVWAGLKRALDLEVITHGSRYPTEVDEIFILSDGSPTTGQIRDPEQILATVTDLNHVNRIRINTVFIEGKDDARFPGQPDWKMSAAELMERIAAQNGGRFLYLRGK